VRGVQRAVLAPKRLRHFLKYANERWKFNSLTHLTPSPSHYPTSFSVPPFHSNSTHTVTQDRSAHKINSQRPDGKHATLKGANKCAQSRSLNTIITTNTPRLPASTPCSHPVSWCGPLLSTPATPLLSRYATMARAMGAVSRIVTYP